MKESQREHIFAKIRSQRCLVCSSKNVDVAHVRTRGAGGPDEEFNLMPLCREHHTEQHKIGIITFMRRYPSVAAYLSTAGWTIENGKLWNDKLGHEALPG
jgi:5-methylcytosine-specific restriction endonuclease McrA